MRARVAGHDVAECVGHRREKGLGQAGRRRDAEGVPQLPRVLGRRDPLLAGQGHDDRPALLPQRRRPGRGQRGRSRVVTFGGCDARGRFVAAIMRALGPVS